MLEGRTVVVTGALGALGSCVADAVEAAGAKVARLDHAKLAERRDLVFDGLDLTDESATSAAMAAIVQRCGGIDGLVNIAGGFAWHTLADAPAKLWDDMFRINLVTAVTATRAALAALSASGSGSIVNIGAGAAAKAAAGMGPYAASKAGVAKLTESLAEELAGAGVRVNALLPSTIDTPANRRDMPKADFSSWVQPADIAKAIVFLLSDQSAAITGAAIPVTAGRRAG
ncbi:MAG TPA: SDR family NAD(P)-dependent oxidoreductase [Caulobacteraceae bacterium]|jgi:NAD(P)-dependent dehydrogenase (short-subunit alcohol dehydrogenase family)|nr:SDR family NAD(P)-dependent oxidoreductase [Caulobacteraceae bacterium]